MADWAQTRSISLGHGENIGRKKFGDVEACFKAAFLTESILCDQWNWGDKMRH